MGYWVLVSGWLGVVTFQFSWFANPLILLSVLWMYRYPIRATLIAASAVLLATQAFWFSSIPGKYENMSIINMGVGFWLWYASLILICMGVVFGSDQAVPTQDQPPPVPSPKPTPAVTSKDSSQPTTLTTLPNIESNYTAANDEKLAQPNTRLPPHFDEPKPLADVLDTKSPTPPSHL